jgi:hypothetical protein
MILGKAGANDDAVCAVIDVGDDTEITDVLIGRHR